MLQNKSNILDCKSNWCHFIIKKPKKSPKNPEVVTFETPCTPNERFPKVAPSLSCRASKGDTNMLEPAKVNDAIKCDQKIFKFDLEY